MCCVSTSKTLVRFHQAVNCAIQNRCMASSLLCDCKFINSQIIKELNNKDIDTQDCTYTYIHTILLYTHRIDKAIQVFC